MEQLDLTSYKNALASLDEVIKVYNSDRENKITRDSLIQRFEYTYSLALKMMKRYFKISAFENDNIEGMTFNEMIRTANKMGLLLSNLEVWNNFRMKRNMTSHTYDESTAQTVVSIIEDFYKDAEFLLNKLEENLS